MEEQFDDLKKIIKEAGVEKPPSAFLNNVMQQIEVVASQESIVYKPLITKRAWGVISLIIAGILLYVLLFASNGESFLDKVDLSFLKIKSFKNPLANITLHKTAVYGVLFLAILFLIQITFLKRRIDKSFSV